jgi:hypothetical protein
MGILPLDRIVEARNALLTQEAADRGVRSHAELPEDHREEGGGHQANETCLVEANRLERHREWIREKERTELVTELLDRTTRDVDWH